MLEIPKMGSYDEPNEFVQVMTDPFVKGERMRLTKFYHADHGVSLAMLAWAFAQVSEDGLVVKTFTLPESFGKLTCGLYGPEMGDSPICGVLTVRDPSRGGVNPPTPIVAGFPLRETDILTIVGMKEGDNFVLYTAYGGPAAPRLPGDSSMTTDEEKEEAEIFWRWHALSDVPAPLNVERYKEISAALSPLAPPPVDPILAYVSAVVG